MNHLIVFFLENDISQLLNIYTKKLFEEQVLNLREGVKNTQRGGAHKSRDLRSPICGPPLKLLHIRCTPPLENVAMVYTPPKYGDQMLDPP